MNKIDTANSNKRYVRLSTTIFQQTLIYSNLTRGASSLWLYLYSLSYHSKDTFYTISQYALADEFGVSRRQLSRYLKELKQQGFLITHTYDEFDRYYTPYLFYECTIPESIESKLNQEKDRKGNKGNKMKNERTELKQEESLPMQDESCLMGETLNVITHDKECHTEDPTHYIYNNNYNIHCRDCYETPILEENNTIENENIQLAEISREVERLSLELNKAKTKLEGAEAIWIGNPCWDNYQAKNRLESIVLGLENDIKVSLTKQEIEKEKIKEEEGKKKVKESLTNDRYLVNNLPGNRIVPKGLMWWITKKLNSIGVLIKDLPKTLNEIVYSVRFGSLVNFKYTFNEMPLMRSINIALKLIKEGKWKDSIDYKKMEVMCG